MSIASDLEGGETGPSWEEILNLLLEEKGVVFHTQVDKPDAMTALDVSGDHWTNTISPGVGKLVASVQKWKRRNMVPYKRARATEIIEGIKGQVEESKRNKNVKEMMAGLQR